jgi:acetolactate synthase-1/2/3 large subunit
MDSIREKGGGGDDFAEMPGIRKIMKDKEEFEREVKEECGVEQTPIPAKRIVNEVSDVFGENTVVVSENGAQDTWSYCFPYFTLREGSEWVPVAEQTCMGMGVVGAIAAKLTRPDKKVVCITGDGAFQMYMKELPTAVQYNAGCTWVVLNNSAFGWPKTGQLDAVGWDTLSFDAQPDFMKWAEACRCFGKKVEKGPDIRPALEEALEANSRGIPAVVEFSTGLDVSHFKRAK